MMRLTTLVLHLCYWASLPWIAQCCRCAREPTLLTAFQFTDVVLQATLLKQLNTSVSDSFISFSAKIIRVWKGCNIGKCSELITITTASEPSACGVLDLIPGTTYFLAGFRDSSTTSVSINSCAIQTPWNSLNVTQQNEVAALSRQYNNCTCTPQNCNQWRGPPSVLCPDKVTWTGPGKCWYNYKLGTCEREIVQCPTCQKHSDCLKGQFCSAGKCRASGTCASDADCWIPENKWATKCAGSSRCNNSVCTIDCANPCPGGVVKCLVDPCKATACKEPYTSCVPNYCGGCNAIFYNSSGYQVCTSTKKTCPDGSPPVNCFADPCKVTSCNESFTSCVSDYCGSCNAKFFDKTGRQVCTSTKKTCPDGSSPVNCFADPCQVTTCNEPHASCVSDYCGGCNAKFYDKAGRQVCTSTKKTCPDGSPPVNCFADPCQVTTCNEPHASCVSDYCGGCNAKFYDKTGRQVCTSTKKTCPDGSPLVSCKADPCQVTTCNEPYASCVANYCGGCNAIFYDKAGNQVCKSTKTTCPDGSPPVNCLVDPCKVTTCNEPYTSCVSDYCGGCNAIFYNSSGNKVCPANK